MAGQKQPPDAPERTPRDALAAVLDCAPMEATSPLYAAVRAHYLFRGMDDAAFARLAGSMQARTLARGDVLFNRGDEARFFYVVHDGLMELSLHSASGSKKVVEIVGPQRTFAEAVAFMRERRYPVTSLALTDCTLCQVASQPYVEMLRANPDACLRLISDLSQHLHAFVREIDNLTAQNARGRLIEFLLRSAGEIDGDRATVHLDIPRHVIAARLSIKPETLSRLLRAFADEGVISVDDRVIEVPSVARLGALL